MLWYLKDREWFDLRVVWIVFSLDLLTFRAELQPGIDLCDRDSLFDRMEDR